MSERDELAALIDTSLENQDVCCYGVDGIELAGRLIAAGVRVVTVERLEAALEATENIVNNELRAVAILAALDAVP